MDCTPFTRPEQMDASPTWCKLFHQEGAVLWQSEPIRGNSSSRSCARSSQANCAQACREYQIGESVMNHWRQEVRLRGEDAAFTPLDTPNAALDYERLLPGGVWGGAPRPTQAGGVEGAKPSTWTRQCRQPGDKLGLRRGGQPAQ